MKSYEAYMPLDLEGRDISAPKEFMKKLEPLTQEISKIARANSSNLLQNSIHIVPEGDPSPKNRKFSLRINRNGISSKDYEYNMSIETIFSATPISVHIGGKIPIKESQAKISEAEIITNERGKYTRMLKINVLNGTQDIKDNLGARDTVLETAYSSIADTVTKLKNGNYETLVEPREGNIDDVIGGLREIPDNLN